MDSKQKEYLRKYNLNRYYRLKTEGICVTCQKEPALPKRTQCSVCRENSKITSRVSFTGKVGKQIYFELFQEQGGRCKICDNEMTRPALDHDHKTGEVRGLLCPGCNSGLGFFKDNPEALNKAASYVQFSRVDTSRYLKRNLIKEEVPVRQQIQKRIFTKTGFEVLD